MVASVRVDARNLHRVLSKVSADMKVSVEKAARFATKRTAFEVLKETKAEMRRAFDNPTRWTLGAFKVEQKPGAIDAAVTPNETNNFRVDSYLGTQALGGTRPLKAFEKALQAAGAMPAGWYAIPGEKARIDRFGNMSPGQIKQLLSWFGAAERSLGYTANSTAATRARRRKGTRKKAGFEYFVAHPGHRIGRGSWQHGRTQNLTPGIYKRTFSAPRAPIEPLLIFVKNAPNYRVRFNHFKVARKVIDREFPRIFNEELQRRFESRARHG